VTVDSDRLWAEIVYIAYHLHWSFESIIGLDHASRRRVIEEIGRITAGRGAGGREWEGP
jgi:hypothetical protein